MSKPKPSFWMSCINVLGSLKLATALFLLLGLLTFAGTLEQQYKSTYAVQTEYFESAYLIWWAGRTVPIPLLGGYLLLSVLFVNLTIGGVIRLRKGTRTLGILIAHLGILSLLAGSFVEDQFSTKGQMKLHENETGNEYMSSQEWEVTVTVPRGTGSTQYVIPWESFKDLDSGEHVEWGHEALPFVVALSDMTTNGQPQPAQPGDPSAIDGFVLRRLKPVGAGGPVNVPALIATLRPTDGTKAARTILSGEQRYPWSVVVADTPYHLALRRRTWAMPFSVRLDRFEHEMYPGMEMAKRYSSFVTKIDGATHERHHITMNEPLRWRGYILYQSSYGPTTPEERAAGTPPYTVLSVVANPSDQWPKWMAWVIAIGMGIQFLMKLVKYLSREERRRTLAAGVVLLSLGLTGCGGEEPTEPAWSKDVVKTMAKVPVQAEGRVKPLSTWAAFALLGLNEKRSCLDADEAKLKPIAWWIDAAFRPAWARKHVCFVITTDEILAAIGHGDIARKKRDRYSYDELATPEARARLSALAVKYREIAPKERGRVHSGVVELDNSLRLFEGMLTQFDWARTDYPLGNASLEVLFDGRKTVQFTDILSKAAELIELARAGMGDEQSGKQPTEEARATGDLLMAAFGQAERTLRVGLFPPGSDDTDASKAWQSMREVAGFALMRGVIAPAHMRILAAMQTMARSPEDAAVFAAGASEWQDSVRRLAEARGEYSQIEREVHLYSFDPLGKSVVFYFIAFFLVTMTWLRPGWRWLRILALVTTWGTLLLHTYAIALRCLIRDRPPISTLYETIIFITASAVLVLLVIEAFGRRRIGLMLAPLLGALGLLMAGGYEVLNGGDTMPRLVAVLDTNFWLWLHVTCISFGYMGTLVAAAIAHIYLFAKLIRGNQLDREFYRSTAAMVYGVLCFGLIFSLVGTILGGIWANDSWGRFWGWDPKENGALLIVLALLAILHARMAGLIKAFGLSMGAVAAGVVVAFSWWGVNLLGIGMHSYGFTEGISKALNTFYIVEGIVLLLGAYTWFRGRGASVAPPLPPVDGSSTS